MTNTTYTYGLTHIALAVKDVNRTLDFYQRVFDMEIMYNEDGFLQLTTPGCHDVLVFEETDEVVSADTGGIAHFGFRLREADSIGELRNKIQQAGGRIIDEGEFARGAPFIFFADPDGYVIEVWYEFLP